MEISNMNVANPKMSKKKKKLIYIYNVSCGLVFTPLHQ